MFTNHYKLYVFIGAFTAGLITLWVVFLMSRRRANRSKAPKASDVIDRLTQSQMFLSSLIDNIPNMIFVKRATDLTFVKFNRAGEKIIGTSQADLIGKSDFDLFPKEQARFFTSQDRKVLSNGQIVEIPEEPISTKSGLRILRTTKIPIYNENHQPIYLLGISEDITDKKALEAQTQILTYERFARLSAERNARHFAFLSNTIEAISTAQNCQDAFGSLARIIAGQMASWCLIDLIDSPSLNSKQIIIYNSNLSQLEEAIIIKEKIPSFENSLKAVREVVTSGKPKLYFQMNDQLLHDLSEGENHYQFLMHLEIKSIMIVPITSFKKILATVTFINSEPREAFSEDDLSFATDLASRISLETEKARLYEKALSANQAKTTFLAKISHELRTPLGSIMGFASLISESGPLNQEQNSFVNTILRNGEQLLNLVNDLLDVSKIETDHLNIANERFSLSIIVEDVLNMIRLKAKEKGLTLELDMRSNVNENIISDPNRIKQILINLIGNAIKFTERGSVSVKIEIFPISQKDDTHNLVATIKDTGIGIDPSKVHNLFEPFTQLSDTTTQPAGGTGLGLHLSKNLALALGGDLQLIESQRGSGSTFKLTIPVKISKLSEEVEPSLKQTLMPTQKTASFKILVIDDSADMRLLVSQILKNMGHQVHTASSGELGLEFLLANDVDIVFLDLQMPNQDGFECFNIFRNHNITSPIIALTAQAMKGDKEKCLDHGFNYYLAKPVRSRDLRFAIEKISKQFMI